MRLFKLFGTKVLAAAIAFSVVPAAIPSNVPVVGVSKAEAQSRYYRGGRGFNGNRGYYRGRDYDRGRGYGNRRYYGGRRYGRRGNGGAAVAGAIIGLGVGAAIASANQPRYYRSAPSYSGSYAFRSPEWYDYCASRYRSFDPRSGTYQPYNGPRRVCR